MRDAFVTIVALLAGLGLLWWLAQPTDFTAGAIVFKLWIAPAVALLLQFAWFAVATSVATIPPGDAPE